MLKSERKQVILEQLKDHRTVSLDSLVHILKTSESTVRRDLDELESEQKLRRIHGGAENIHFYKKKKAIKKNLSKTFILSRKLQKKLLALFRIMMLSLSMLVLQMSC